MTDDIIAWVEPRTPARSGHKLGRLFDRMDDEGIMVSSEISAEALVSAYFPLMVYRAAYRKLRASSEWQPLGVVAYHSPKSEHVVICRAFNPA